MFILIFFLITIYLPVNASLEEGISRLKQLNQLLTASKKTEALALLQNPLFEDKQANATNYEKQLVEALVVAVRYGDLETVQAIVDKGLAIKKIITTREAAYIDAQKTVQKAVQEYNEIQSRRAEALSHNEQDVNTYNMLRKQADLAKEKTITTLQEAQATESLLFSACENNKKPQEIIEYLLDNGASGATKKIGYLSKDHTEIVFRTTLLHTMLGLPPEYLIGRDDKLRRAVIRLLLKKTPTFIDVNEKSGPSKSTALHTARSKEDIMLLLEQGALINAQDEDGNTLLHKKVEVANVELVTFLISQGADVNIKNFYGETPLHLTQHNTNLDIAEALLKKEPTLLDKTDNLGNTILHKVVNTTPLTVTMVNKMQFVKFLVIQQKAHLDIKNNEGNTPLYYAIKCDNKDIAELLIENGASVIVKNAQRLTPLHVATQLGKEEFVTLLLKHNAPVNLKNNNGATPLHYAAMGGYTNIEKLLIKNGADINKKNKFGSTPLHLAYSYGHMQAAQFLIKKGASITATDEEGETPAEKNKGVVTTAPSLQPLTPSNVSSTNQGQNVTTPSKEGDTSSLGTTQNASTKAISCGIALSFIVGGALFYYLKKKRSLPETDNDLFDEKL